MIDWICSKHFVHDSWLRSNILTNFDQDCSLRLVGMCSMFFYPVPWLAWTSAVRWFVSLVSRVPLSISGVGLFVPAWCDVSKMAPHRIFHTPHPALRIFFSQPWFGLFALFARDWLLCSSLAVAAELPFVSCLHYYIVSRQSVGRAGVSVPA